MAQAKSTYEKAQAALRNLLRDIGDPRVADMMALLGKIEGERLSRLKRGEAE